MNDKPKLAVVQTISESNRRDIPATLRVIADQIERGDISEVICVTLVLRCAAVIDVCHLGEGETNEALATLALGKHKLERSMLKHIEKSS